MNNLNNECSTCLYSAYFRFGEWRQPGAVNQWNDFLNWVNIWLIAGNLPLRGRNPSFTLIVFWNQVNQARPETSRLARQASPFLLCFWSRLINLISKDTTTVFSIFKEYAWIQAGKMYNIRSQVYTNLVKLIVCLLSFTFIPSSSSPSKI